MNSRQKLRLIKNISGLTQEKLAQELGVSFATLNSWINNRSTPRKKAQQHIDELCRQYTGQKVIPLSVLQAKKEVIANKSKKHRNVLGYILKNPDIYDQFMLSLTYNTNRIEGSTLTEPETAAILFKNIALPNKDLIEQLEVKNHQAALEYLLKYCMDKKNITEALILKLHGILMNGIRHDAGTYRRHAVRIAGANVPTANYLKIPSLMEDLIKDISSLKNNIISGAAKTHARFEQIHPFSDGNGRIGRLLIHAMLLSSNISPALVRQEKKQLYYSYLNKAQQENDPSLLEDFLCDAILEGFALIERKKTV